MAVKKENLLITIITAVIIGSGLFYFSEFNTKRMKMNDCNRIYKMKVNGIIDTAYYTKQGTFVIKVKNNSIVIYGTYLGIPNPNRFFNIGDSLFKPENSFKYYIYKQCNSDSLIILEREITCDEYISNIYGE